MPAGLTYQPVRSSVCLPGQVKTAELIHQGLPAHSSLIWPGTQIEGVEKWFSCKRDHPKQQFAEFSANYKDNPLLHIGVINKETPGYCMPGGKTKCFTKGSAVESLRWVLRSRFYTLWLIALALPFFRERLFLTVCCCLLHTRPFFLSR